MKSKTKKRVCKWDQVIFYLRDFDITRHYLTFKTNHRDMSCSRCAFYILKKYFSGPLLSNFRQMYLDGFDYEECIKWMNFSNKVGLENALL